MHTNKHTFWLLVYTRDLSTAEPWRCSSCWGTALSPLPTSKLHWSSHLTYTCPPEDGDHSISVHPGSCTVHFVNMISLYLKLPHQQYTIPVL